MSGLRAAMIFRRVARIVSGNSEFSLITTTSENSIRIEERPFARLGNPFSTVTGSKSLLPHFHPD
ncbi:hypothetical protein AC629_02900 [Bradyrhizobium sp. NAS80.1]|uniref:hypothetical protein n=1 Tax=Bradyrhizobium sp. NAS80.1 TaxID=1680159 RepID=UPI000962E9B2|nr:hypothetical protein [Bradyrhizobium sp. NAS80.1]OKO91183.1 hypothetical protein AC629_02900 [Bradyrhizobium sp. NAS80.1]